MKTVKYGKGKSAIEFSGTQRRLIMENLKKAEPIIMLILETEIEDLKENSERNWLVRQEKYGKSQGSKDKHRTGIRVIPPSTIEAFVTNTAEYAWAIRVGRESKTSVPKGRKLADELLWKPAKKNADRIVLEIAKQTVRQLKKVK